MEIKITEKRYIGDQHPCYIIMDVAANHNGDLETAKKLIEVSAKMGADVIKFQTYTAEMLYSEKTPLFSHTTISPFDLIKQVQHPREWLPVLKEVADNHSIDFSSSPFDFEAVDLLEQINVPFYKIASAEIVDLELIAYIAKKGKPIIISTGMSYMEDIEDAVNTVLENNNDKIILLHCNTLYPTPLEAVNLKAIKTLEETFKYPIGFSDHTIGINISLAAVAMGARVIERHITLNKDQEGPDHKFALEPDDLKTLVENIRRIENAKWQGEDMKSFIEGIKNIGTAMGDGVKKPHALELEENFEKGRRSIIAAIDISEGTKITREMLIVKRPGYGIKPKFIKSVIGKRPKFDIEKEQWITWDDLI